MKRSNAHTEHEVTENVVYIYRVTSRTRTLVGVLTRREIMDLAKKYKETIDYTIKA